MVSRSINSVKKRSDTELKADLACFWGRHPHAKFTLGVVVGALGGGTRKADVEKALESLVTANLVDKHIQQGLPFYCLATNLGKQELLFGQTIETGPKHLFMQPVQRG